MFTEKNNEYINERAKVLLNEIKKDVTLKKIVIQNEQATDKRMLEIIKDLYTNNNNSLINITPPKIKGVEDGRIVLMVLYYTAIDNNNVELLNELKAKRFDFGNGLYNLKLFALDRRLSSCFDKKEYIDLLLHKEDLFWNFTRNLDNSIMDQNACIKEFAKILKKNPHIADLKKEDTKSTNLMLYLLSPKNIAFFGSELILSSPYEKRKNTMNDYGLNYLNKEGYKRILKLMENPYFSLDMPISPKELLNLFNDEEIIKLCQDKDYYFSECFDKQTNKYDMIKLKFLLNNQDYNKLKTKKDFRTKVLQRIYTIKRFFN